MSGGLRVGDLELHRIVEAPAAPPVEIFEPKRFFPGIDPDLLAEATEALPPGWIDPATGTVVLCIQSFLVRTPELTILVDTCVGNHKPRPDQPYWSHLAGSAFEDGLAAAGASFESIDVVLGTHLHVDHVGWNTRLDGDRWVPSFPNATYVLPGAEVSHWIGRSSPEPDEVPWVADSVAPILSSGQALVVSGGATVLDAIEVVPTPGHTVGHTAYRVHGAGGSLLFVGDLLHSPIQARHPELAMRADHDPVQAADSRRRTLEAACGTGEVVCPAHLPGPSVGAVVRDGDGYAFALAEPDR